MVKDARGWPPVRAEHVWAERCGEDLFRAVPSALETGPVFVERVAWSGNCTIRVMPVRNGDLADDDVGLVVDACGLISESGWPIDDRADVE